MRKPIDILTGRALDWAAAYANGDEPSMYLFRKYSTEWHYAGPIIEREQITLICAHGYKHWIAEQRNSDQLVSTEGETALIAAMRCFVMSYAGDEIYIPEEIFQ